MKIAACEVRVYLGPDDTDRLDTLCVQQGKARDELLRQWVRERLREEFEPQCNCDGGPQGEGCVSIPHEPHCPLVNQ